MKAKIAVPDLQFALRIAKDVVQANATPKELTGILLNVKQDRAQFVAMNPQIAVRVVVAATSLDDGTALISAEDLVATSLKFKSPDVNGYGTGEVSLSSTAKSLNVSTKTVFSSGAETPHKKTLNILNHELFPKLPEVQEKSKATIDFNLLQKAIAGIQFAVSSDDRLPILRSVFAEAKEGLLCLAATNGVCVSETTLAINLEGEEFSVNLPVSFINKIQRSYLEDDTLSIITDGKMVTSAAAHLNIYAPLIYGIFPDYRAVFPKDGQEILVEKEVLVFNLNNLQHEASSVDDNRLSFSVKDKELSLTVGQSCNEGIPVFSDASFSFDCNIHLLISCLKEVKTDLAKIVFAGPGKPVSVSNADKLPMTYRSLLVPLNK